MTKTQAISLLGGSVSKAAAAIGINPQAISQWPTELPDRLIDRVQAALYRQQQTKESVPAGDAGGRGSHD